MRPVGGGMAFQAASVCWTAAELAIRATAEELAGAGGEVGGRNVA
jgi:hypothetical protein